MTDPQFEQLIQALKDIGKPLVWIAVISWVIMLSQCIQIGIHH